MLMRMPFARYLALASSLLIAGGCAATTPAPRFTTVSPADPAAAESTVPPLAPLLTSGGELAEKTTTEPAGPARGQVGHEDHGPTGDAAAFTCSMHPEVTAKEPGNCPICGMALVKQAAPKERR